MNKYTTFKKFPDAAEAKQLQAFLIDNEIECVFIDTSSPLGTSIMGEGFKEYEIQMKQSDFEKAHELMEQQAEDMMLRIDKDYYLLTFSDEELYDVVLKQDEWNQFDYVLARKLLAQRGKAIDDKELKVLRYKRMQELARPEKNHKGWIIAGYVSAVLGGILGVIIGYVLKTSKKTLPNGIIVPTYSQKDRNHGSRIFLIGTVVIPLYIVIRLLLMYF